MQPRVSATGRVSSSLFISCTIHVLSRVLPRGGLAFDLFAFLESWIAVLFPSSFCVLVQSYNYKNVLDCAI